MMRLLLLPGLVPALPCGKNRAFIDLGANDGQSLSWFEAELLHRSPTPYTSVTAFEMNPAFEAVLRQTLSRLPAGRLERAAAWVEEGSMEAHLQPNPNPNPNPCPRPNPNPDHNVDPDPNPDQAHLQLPGSRTATKGGALYNMTASALMVGGKPLNRGPGGGGAPSRGRAARRNSGRVGGGAAHQGVFTVPTVDMEP